MSDEIENEKNSLTNILYGFRGEGEFPGLVVNAIEALCTAIIKAELAKPKEMPKLMCIHDNNALGCTVVNGRCHFCGVHFSWEVKP